MAFYISFAGHTFRIEPKNKKLYDYCKNFICEPTEDCFDATASFEDMEYERAHDEEMHASEALIESLAVYRKIAEYLPAHGSLLFHASVIQIDGNAYAFTAKSGTGKSTHTRLLTELLGDRAVMINDDKPILTYKDGKVFASGTPWNGKHRLSSNITSPLHAICFLQRGDVNSIERVNGRDVFAQLLSQTYRPRSKEALEQTLHLITHISESVELYRLRCNMEPEAAVVSYNGMVRKDG